MVLFNNVTIILQGIISKDVDIINTLNYYTKIAKVIISTYFLIGNDNIIKNIIKNFPEIIILFNNYEEYKSELISKKKYNDNTFYNNCFYQIKTTMKALEIINTEYTVKTRVDHFYSALADGDMIRWAIDLKKILSLSLFVRGTKWAKYHLSDFLFIGNTIEINKIMNLAYKNYNVGCPEINIWKPYIFYIAKIDNVDIENLNDLEYATYMDSKFYIYCINRNQNYKIKFANNIHTKVKDVDKTTNNSINYFLYGCD
jgi:hypothetical protein